MIVSRCALVSFLLLLVFSLEIPTTTAFAPSSRFSLHTKKSQQEPLLHTPALTTMSSSSSDEEMTTTEEVASVMDKAPVQEGTHEELMYALGVNLARQLGDVRPLVENGQELAVLTKGLVDTLIGQLSEEGQKMLLGRRGQDLNELVTERALKIQQRLETAGREMLDQMKQTEGVKVLDSGVVLHVLEYGPEGEGRGVRPTQASTVKIHYHGTMPDGTTFDSTLGKEPVSLPLASVIPGWREGVLKMHEGETAMIGIPPELAYGEKGTPDGRIPGGSTLFFKVQLLEVMSAGIGGGPTLLGADGKKLTKTNSQGSGLLGADGKPM